MSGKIHDENNEDDENTRTSAAIPSPLSDSARTSTDPLAETLDTPLPPPPEGAAPDETPASFGRYQVLKVIGSGGFGTVFLGHDPQLNRRVAIKIPGGRATTTQSTAKFLREARQLAQLNHPGIVTVFDVGVEAGRCYIVSDFLEGTSLNVWLKQQRPSWQDTVRLVAAVADALAHAHAHRTVHRDVKPSNIILKDDKTPVLVDFGVAISDESAAGERGIVIGTPHYMAPEQASGQAHRIDGRTDIYALGVVLYRALCGHTPFKSANTMELMRQVLEDEPQPLRQLATDVPRELEQICEKAMAKRSADRYRTAGDMASALRSVLEDAETRLPSDPQQATFAAESPTQATSMLMRAREAQRRQVTVLYCECEVFDSAAFLEDLDPEEQHEVLSDYHEMCDEVVQHHGGAVVQSTGKALIVCFGYPMAFEDSARRAVLAALEIQRRVSGLLEPHAARIDARQPWIGIHTGMVIAKTAAEGASPEPLSLVGEARSVATQLKVQAEAGDVVLTRATQRLVAGYFLCEDLGEHAIVGSSRPVELYKVLGETAARSRIEVAEPVGLTPLVGRQTELAVLQDRWEFAADGQGQVVLLVGDAGLGKSRLVHEISQHVQSGAAGPEGQVISWYGSPYFQNSGLYPAREYLERLLDFQRDEEPAARLDKLIAHLTDCRLAGAETTALLASLLSLPLDSRCPPLELGPQRQKELTQQALLDWLRARSARQPVLLIVEDLHWVDPSTLEFLSQLVTEGFGEPVLMLLTFRPEFSTPWPSKSHQTQVALNRLTKAQVRDMMQRRLGMTDLPAEMVAQLVDRTEGVPLFVEEFTNLVKESGALQEVDGRPQLTDDFSLASIPNTLQDLLTSRLDRLESDPLVVQLCATLGREFPYELLKAACDLEAAILDEELAKLVRAELMFQKGRPPHRRYEFKHVLIQDAAYQSLLKKQRQQFHQRVAEVLEEQFPASVQNEPELLAHHFTEAGQLEKSIPYWLAAGQRSQAHFDVAEAIHHLTRGLDLVAQLEAGPQRDQLELSFQLPLGGALLQARGYANDETGQTFVRARQLCEQLGPAAPLFQVLWGIWAWHLVRNELVECQEPARRQMQLAEESGDDGLIMEACFTLGSADYYLGRFVEARQRFERAWSLYDDERCRQHGQLTGQNCGPATLNYLALTLWQLGEPDAAQARGRQAVDLAAQIAHPYTQSFTAYHYGWLNHYLRLGDEVQRSGQEGYKLSFQQGYPLGITLGIMNQGIGRLIEGGLDEAQAADAMRQMEDGLNGFLASGARLHISHCYALFAALQLGIGQLDAAEQQLQKAFQAAIDSQELCDEAELHRLRGELLLARSPDNQDQAEKCFNASLDIARRQQARSWQLRTTTSLARLWKQQGRADEAAAALAEALAHFDEESQMPDVQAARLLMNG